MHERAECMNEALDPNFFDAVRILNPICYTIVFMHRLGSPSEGICWGVFVSDVNVGLRF